MGGGSATIAGTGQQRLQGIRQTGRVDWNAVNAGYTGLRLSKSCSLQQLTERALKAGSDGTVVLQGLKGEQKCPDWGGAAPGAPSVSSEMEGPQWFPPFKARQSCASPRAQQFHTLPDTAGCCCAGRSAAEAAGGSSDGSEAPSSTVVLMGSISVAASHSSIARSCRL